MHHHIKPPVDPAELEHRNLRQGEFWRAVPAYADVDEATFLDHIWQGRHSVKTTDELFETIGWTRPYEDPIRRQFIPVASKLLPDHPMLTLDSLHEQDDSPVQGLTHRYVDKVLFLPLQTCPVYCRFCTRSYAVGPDTADVDKAPLAKTTALWKDAFDYIASRPEIEDIVISGGDAYQLSPKSITTIGESLLAIPHVRRLRYATKGLAVMPMKILTDAAWTDALTGVVEHGRALRKDVVIHTHFNSPGEISWITEQAMKLLLNLVRL